MDNCLRFARPAEARPEARGQRPEARGQPETKIQMRSNRVGFFLVCQLAVGFLSLCVWVFWLSWFQVVSWMDATSHFHARPFRNKGETDFMLPAVCSVSPFNLYAAKGLLLRSSSSKHAFFEMRVDGAKTKQCHAHTVRLDRKL